MNFFKKLILIFLLINLAISLSNTEIFATTEVTLKKHSKIKSGTVYLKDIALISSDNNETLELLENIYLGSSPAGRQIITLKKRQLEQKIFTAIGAQENLKINSPEEILLSSEGKILDEEEIKNIILEYLEQTEPYQSADFEIISLNARINKTLPETELSYYFIPQNSANPSRLTGFIHINAQGQEIEKIRVNAIIELNIPAIVAARNLSKGTIINENDILTSLVPYNQAKNAIDSNKLAVGATVKNQILEGQVIKEKDLSKSILVKKGEMVNIIAQSGSVSIKATGEARQDGVLGQTISIMNLDSKKIISGKIIAPNTVEVTF